MAKGLRAKLFASRIYDLSLGARAQPPRPVPADLLELSVSPAAPDDSLAWLAGLDPAADGATRENARARLGEWLSTNRQWRADSWRADLIGQRLAHVIPRFSVITEVPAPTFRQCWPINCTARHDTFSVWRRRNETPMIRSRPASAPSWRRDTCPGSNAASAKR